MFHVKHVRGHALAIEASDGFEYAPADAHDIRRARLEEQSEPGVDLAPGRLVLATAGGRRARGAVRAARHLPTGQTMPEAVRLYPKAWVPIANDPTAGGCESRSNEGAAESASSLVLWGGRRSRARATRRGHGRGMIDCGVIRATNLPTLFDQSVCPVSRETAENDARQHGDGCQSFDSSRRIGCSKPGQGWRMPFSERGPQRRPRVCSSHRRIVWDPCRLAGSMCRSGASHGGLAECL